MSLSPHTFGGERASENLAEILRTQYPVLVWRVGRYYGRFTRILSSLVSSYEHFSRKADLTRIMEMYRDEEFGRVKKLNLPQIVESHLLNVMTAAYREKLNGISRKRRKNHKRQK